MARKKQEDQQKVRAVFSMVLTEEGKMYIQLPEEKHLIPLFLSTALACCGYPSDLSLLTESEETPDLGPNHTPYVS